MFQNVISVDLKDRIIHYVRDSSFEHFQAYIMLKGSGKKLNRKTQFSHKN